MVVEEELNQTVTEEATPEPKSDVKEEINKNYEELIEQQREQIHQLLKQQEVNKKMVQQLTEANKQFQEAQQRENSDSIHWVDKVIQNNFKNDFPSYDPENVFFAKGNTEHLATWYVKYLKNQGCTNDEINTRMGNIFKHIEKLKQADGIS